MYGCVVNWPTYIQFIYFVYISVRPVEFSIYFRYVTYALLFTVKFLPPYRRTVAPVHGVGGSGSDGDERLCTLEVLGKLPDEEFGTMA